MKKVHNLLRGSILEFIDFFYPLFRKIMPLQTFRYAACGGGNTLLDICLFTINYNVVFRKQNVRFGLVTLSPHIASFLLAFLITFPIGFYLSRYVVFQKSELKRRTQLIRYFQVVLCCILLNYVFIKLFVEYLGWYPTPAKIMTTSFVVAFSYMSQTYYSFKSKKAQAIN
jgi:putative flippase GtrA